MSVEDWIDEELVSYRSHINKDCCGDICDNNKDKTLDQLRSERLKQFLLFDKRYREYLIDRRKGYSTWRAYDDLDDYGGEIVRLDITIEARYKEHVIILYEGLDRKQCGHQNLPKDLCELICDFV